MMCFFSVDGAFGSAEPRDLLIIDCAQFTDDDWADIQGATDSSRASVAWRIASSYGAVEYQPTTKQEE